MMATRIDCGNFIRRDCIGKRVELRSTHTEVKGGRTECPTRTSEDARAYIARRNSTTWDSAQRPSLLPLASAR